jgi:hypothetical protein
MELNRVLDGDKNWDTDFLKSLLPAMIYKEQGYEESPRVFCSMVVCGLKA